MDSFDQWRTSVINQMASMLEEMSEPALATRYFERHTQAIQNAWARGEDALLCGISIVNAERELIETLEAESQEEAQRNGADSYFDRESELIEHWRQDCLNNDLI